MEHLSKEDIKSIKNTLSAVVRLTVEEAMLTNNEVWISGKQLAEQFSMFGRDWQIEYGHLLPRTQTKILKDGRVIEGKWAYPRNRIQQMIMNNEIKSLKFRIKNEDQSRN